MRADRTTAGRRPRAHGGSAGALPVAVAPRARDPLWSRVGLIVLAGLLLAPVAAALGREEGGVRGQPTGAAIAIVQPAGHRTATTPTAAVPAPSTTVALAPAAALAEPSTLGVPEVPTIEEPASVAQPDQASAERERVCSLTYEVRPGDYWLGIAERAQVSPYELATTNGATLASPLYPGDVLCLPEGARHPVPPPSTVAPPTTAAARPTPTPTTSAAPATTRPPAPTTAPPASPSRRSPQSYSAAEVKEIIRSVFPDDQQERAIEIAWRESNWKPWVYNGHCCYGLFQIYWSVHRSWLDEVGVHSSDDLLDPWLNAVAAYTLYQRSGNSWGPWGG